MFLKHSMKAFLVPKKISFSKWKNEMRQILKINFEKRQLKRKGINKKYNHWSVLLHYRGLGVCPGTLFVYYYTCEGCLCLPVYSFQWPGGPECLSRMLILLTQPFAVSFVQLVDWHVIDAGV